MKSKAWINFQNKISAWIQSKISKIKASVLRKHQEWRTRPHWNVFMVVPSGPETLLRWMVTSQPTALSGPLSGSQAQRFGSQSDSDPPELCWDPEPRRSGQFPPIPGRPPCRRSENTKNCKYYDVCVYKTNGDSILCMNGGRAAPPQGENFHLVYFICKTKFKKMLKQREIIKMNLWLYEMYRSLLSLMVQLFSI